MYVHTAISGTTANCKRTRKRARLTCSIDARRQRTQVLLVVFMEHVLSVAATLAGDCSVQTSVEATLQTSQTRAEATLQAHQTRVEATLQASQTRVEAILHANRTHVGTARNAS